MSEERETIYVLKLKAPRDNSGIRKLRFLLKRLLRGYGLRCLSVEEEKSP
jgi:hypothetical protein